MPRSATRGSRPQGGFLGLYALRMMEEGPIYVHQVANRIAERTQGAWRPSPGALYPSVRSLVDRGLAGMRRVGNRTIFTITPAGRRRLRGSRTNPVRWQNRFVHAWRLWLDFVSPEEMAEFLAQRVRTDLTVARSALTADEGALPPAERRYLTGQLRAELERALGWLGERAPAARSGRRGG